MCNELPARDLRERPIGHEVFVGDWLFQDRRIRYASNFLVGVNMGLTLSGVMRKHINKYVKPAERMRRDRFEFSRQNE